ncbi:MAG: glycosyltransferase [Acidimicrobiales bacterium]
MSRIALVSEHASPLAALGTTDAGGQNVYVACLASALAARGHHVVVYTRRDDPRGDMRVVVRPGTTGSYEVVHVHAGPATPIDKDALFPYMDEFAADLRHWFERERPDVVHSHFWMSGYAAFAAAGTVHTPMVHTFHALGTVKQRHQGDADGSPPERLGLEHQLLRHVDRVVATCTDEVAELRAMAGREHDPTDAAWARVAVVPCGYDASVFRQCGQRLPRSDRPLLAAVSRLVPRKGLDVVLRAMAELPDAELIVAGGPPVDQLADDPCHAELASLADELGLGRRVRFVGGVAPTAIAAIDRTADVFVAAPRYEPFGIAPVEAMACGTPVVATAVGGMLDTVIDGGTGTLVPVDDPDALARAVRDLVDHPSRLAAHGERAAWRTRRRYAWSVVARAMEHVYAEVIAGSAVGTGRRGTGA